MKAKNYRRLIYVYIKKELRDMVHHLNMVHKSDWRDISDGILW